MKYAITGHTGAIGGEIYRRLNPEIMGFSRRAGLDISVPEHRKEIIRKSFNCNTFINLAPGYSQVLMLIDLFKEWCDLEKTIINVGSRITEIKLPKNRLELLEYQSEKLALKTMTEQMQGYKCRVLYRWFPYVQTPAMVAKYPLFTQRDFITIEQAADIILADTLV